MILRDFVAKLLGRPPALGTDQMVAIDGKTNRRSTNKADPNPLHLVNAFAAGVGVVLGQTAADEKSNEITAIPELLATLALKGCIVTIDAMGTQTDIAHAIRAREADYVLCVKDNHPKLSESILLAQAGVGGKLKAVSRSETTTTGHGRTEVRRCWAFDAVERLYKESPVMDSESYFPRHLQRAKCLPCLGSNNSVGHKVFAALKRTDCGFGLGAE